MKIILTTMCMIYNDDGTFLVQDRVSKKWPGINFPGGKVEENETVLEGCIREIKEETGLDILDVEQCGHFEWYVPEKEERHVAILFRTKKYTGNLIDSNEGKVYFTSEEKIKNLPQSIDFDKVLEISKKGLNF